MKKRIIRTVLGDIEPKELGHCQCHEHLFISKGRSFEINPALWMDDKEAGLKELLLYKSCGGASIVDAQPNGCGAMPEELFYASSKSGVNIIASTGFHKLCFYPKNHWIYTRDAETLTEYFIQDIEIGMSLEADHQMPSMRSTVKAGMIKSALDKDGLTRQLIPLFEAAAICSCHTGAPIMVHTENGKGGRELITFLLSHGVASDRIILCHVDRNIENPKEKVKLLEEGVFFQCDTIGREKYHDDKREAEFLFSVAEAGYIDQILIGLDTTRQRLKSYGGAIGLDYIIKTFLPVMKTVGFSEGQLKKILYTNPSRAVSMEKK